MDIDPGFLKWLNRQYQTYGFQRVVLEALERLYKDMQGADCHWEHSLVVKPAAGMVPPSPIEQRAISAQQPSPIEPIREETTPQNQKQESENEEEWGNVFDMLDDGP
ncbi:hypothetical protein [Alicyclobacillus kakegawensis]|uniref:hypothetical protein n=1 Tax=Alicyclobacillus kakegawensis TaxID=392012 RepID=UPI000A7B04B0|nr:hypothetical protein [Alicyclobacillus kakegawensis]